PARAAARTFRLRAPLHLRDPAHRRRLAQLRRPDAAVSRHRIESVLRAVVGHLRRSARAGSRSLPACRRHLPYLLRVRQPTFRETGRKTGRHLWVVGTFDTKAAELNYLAGLIREAGVPALTVDISTRSHDAVADIPAAEVATYHPEGARQDRKSTRLNSSHVKISYAVFCLKKKTKRKKKTTTKA